MGDRLELPLSDDDWPFVDTISCDDILAPATSAAGRAARAEARRRLETFGVVVFRDVVPAVHCREMRQDMWRHVETVAAAGGFDRGDPATWGAWKKRGNYGMPGKNTVFTPPFLALRQSARVAACFAVLMDERSDDLIASHDRWLLYLKTAEEAGSSAAFKTRRNIHLDLNPWEYVESDPRVYEDLAKLTYASTRDFTRELNAGHALVGPELPETAPTAGHARSADFAAAAATATDAPSGDGDGGAAPPSLPSSSAGPGRGAELSAPPQATQQRRRRRAGGLSLQGLVNLRDNRPNDGGTLVVPRPPAKFTEWLATQPETQRTRGAMQFHIDDSNDPLWASAQRVPVREGCMLVWDRRTVHGAAPNNSDRCRFGVPITFTRRAELELFPKRARARAAALERELAAVDFEGRLTPLGVRLFGLDVPGAARFSKRKKNDNNTQRQLQQPHSDDHGGGGAGGGGAGGGGGGGGGSGDRGPGRGSAGGAADRSSGNGSAASSAGNNGAVFPLHAQNADNHRGRAANGVQQAADADDRAAARAMAAAKLGFASAGATTTTAAARSGEVLDALAQHADEVRPGLWLGSENAAADAAALRARGVRAVLVPAFTGHPHTPPPLFAGRFRYVIWPVQDVPGFPLIWAFPTFVREIRAALRMRPHAGAGHGGGAGNCGDAAENLNGGGHDPAVLVHCANGVSRSAAVVAAYLMATEGLGAGEAFEAVRRVRPGVSNRKFREQLELWGALGCRLDQAGDTVGAAAGGKLAAAALVPSGGGGDGDASDGRDRRRQLLVRLSKRFSLRRQQGMRQAIKGTLQTVWPRAPAAAATGCGRGAGTAAVTEAHCGSSDP